MTFIHNINLPEKNKFSEMFNHVSELWEKSQDLSLTEKERKEYLDAFWKEKYCLEQGIY